MPLRVRKRRDSPYYHAEGTVPGYGRVRESTGTSKLAEAREYAAELEARLRTEAKQGQPRKKAERTVADAIVEYVENTGRTQHLNRINEVLGRVPLSQINQETIDRAARKALADYKRGKKGVVRRYKPASVRRLFYAPLATVLHYAHDLGWMPYIRVKMPKAVRPPPRWADKQWFAEFFKVADADLRALVLFLAGTGCRVSEALNLRRRDVDLATGTAYVRTTKNGDPREVYLPPFVAEAIQPYVNSKEPGKKGRMVIPAFDCPVFGVFKTRHSVNDALARAAKKAGIEYLSSHKVGSHTFATNLARFAGMDSRALTETGRWKDPKSAAHYTHFVKREAAQKADHLKALFEDE